ncbi:MAG: glycine zipper 2TM domain-containing protein [Burkholderiales bacterium]|nr:glycine zipper 2TM domain-containing protein [Burkholderiales bacterium]
MKRVIPAVAACACAVGAQAAQDFVDTAQVISSTPIIERVTEPRQECWQEPAGAPARERNVVAPIVGGVAGALLGSQVGRGSGRTAATAAGAVAGTVIGDRVANPDSDRPVTGAVVGGAAGGLLGAQVGSGSGRNAAAAAGAIGGTIVGDRVQNPQGYAQPVQRCRTVETTREVVRGYTVVYRYNGRDVTTTMPYDPGRTVRVGVGIADGPPASAPPPAGYGTTTTATPPPPAYGYPPAQAAPVGATGTEPHRY